MAKKKFLYLDDNDKVTRDGDVELINAYSKKINIVTDYPCSWSQRAKRIISDISEIDGLILDWELTNRSPEAKEGSEKADDVDFTAESLAEHIRVKVVQDGIRDIPIIVCSADKNKAFSTARRRERTSQDLFDLSFIKNNLFVENVETAEKQLFDLAFAYEYYRHKSSIEDALGLTADDRLELDVRFIESYDKLVENNTTHDLIQFLLNDFILSDGLLIGLEVVAARLGIDISKSVEEWEKLLQAIKEADLFYNGVMSDGWTMVWAHRLNKWWNEIIPTYDLRNTIATDRVMELNTKLGLSLVAAEKIKYCTSTEYWTICRGVHRPIDPLDGYRIDTKVSQPWLEPRYVSALAELEKPSANAWTISILDKERFIRFREIIKSVK